MLPIIYIYIEFRSVNRYIINMTFLDLLSYNHLTAYQLSLDSGIPKTTIQDICSGKSNLLNCDGRTLLELSKRLNTSIEQLLDLEKEEQKTLFPKFLNISIDNLRKSIRDNSSLIDSYYDELMSSINVAEVDHYISKETADRLRKRYLND